MSQTKTAGGMPQRLGVGGGGFGPPVRMPLDLRTKTLASQSPRQWHPNSSILR